MQVKKLIGIDGYKAFTVFNRVLISLQALPTYQGFPYRVIYTELGRMDEVKRNMVLKEICMLYDFHEDDLISLIKFTLDNNGVPISERNIKNMKPDEILDRALAVMVEIANIKIDILTEEEKENLEAFSVNLRGELAKDANASLDSMLNMAFLRAVKNGD